MLNIQTLCRWRISRDCLDNEKKQHRRRHKSGDGHFKLTSNFPFAIGDVVQIVNTIQFVRLVKDLHAVEFHKELLKCGTVLGYSSFSLVVVKFGNRKQHVPTNFLHKADQTATQKHKNAVAARNNLKVNDTVMLEHWSGPFLLSLDTKALILRVILSTSKLIGISDDTDEAFVQCDNTVFAVPTTFITAPTSELELYQVIQKLPAQFDGGLESGMLGRIMGIIETCLSEIKNTLKANHESRSLCIKKMGTVNSGEMSIKFATSTNMMSDDVKEISARLSEIQRHEFNVTASGNILQVKVKLSDYDHTGKESEQSTPSQIIPGVTLQLPVQSEVTDRPQENFLNRAMDTLDTESDKISGFESETDREEFVDDEAEYLSGGPSLAGEEADDDVINVDSSEDVTGIFQANERSDVESVQHELL